MPHKHKRRERDASAYELPPTQLAKPLPVRGASRKTEPAAKTGKKEVEQGTKRKRGNASKDDAPRAFKRLMAFAQGKPTRSGLDDGTDAKPKKTKNTEAVEDTKGLNSVPSIKPGESMSDFAARVDQALPLGGLINKTAKGGKDPLGLKVWRTRKEMKMHKLYDEWREEERKIKEQKEEEAELEEERALEDDEAGVTWNLDDSAALGGTKRKKGRKGHKGKYLGEATDREEDPWQELKRKRGETKAGLHDVVQAPPELAKFTGKKPPLRNVGAHVENIPKAAGSLRRREELEGVRKDVLASYRKLMEEKRAAPKTK